MYGIPPGTDLSFLTGASLLQICIGENEVILNLDHDISIMIASNVQVSSPDERPTVLEAAKDLGTVLLPLVSATILDTVSTSNGELQLIWNTGFVTTLLDTWKEFESYTVRNGETLFVI